MQLQITTGWEGGERLLLFVRCGDARVSAFRGMSRWLKARGSGAEHRPV